MTLADELERLAEKATEGPWDNVHVATGRGTDWVVTKGLKPLMRVHRLPQRDEEEERANAALSVALRNNLPAIIAALRAQEWQPIETAPRDGTRVLLCAHDWYKPVIGSFLPSSEGWYHGDEEAGLPYGECKPTHWMPLPSPPAHDKGEPKP